MLVTGRVRRGSSARDRPSRSAPGTGAVGPRPGSPVGKRKGTSCARRTSSLGWPQSSPMRPEGAPPARARACRARQRVPADARVSTRDQHPDTQHDALTAARGDHIYIDRASGKLARRDQARPRGARRLRAADQLVITKLDRLVRSLGHLPELSRRCTSATLTSSCSTRASTPAAPSGGCSSRSSARSPRPSPFFLNTVGG